MSLLYISRETIFLPPLVCCHRLLAYPSSATACPPGDRLSCRLHLLQCKRAGKWHYIQKIKMLSLAFWALASYILYGWAYKKRNLAIQDIVVVRRCGTIYCIFSHFLCFCCAKTMLFPTIYKQKLPWFGVCFALYISKGYDKKRIIFLYFPIAVWNEPCYTVFEGKENNLHLIAPGESRKYFLGNYNFLLAIFS